ncbi:MAG: peptidoglycan-binding domain-containing protein [Pseudonocardiaceae bacterium]
MKGLDGLDGRSTRRPPSGGSRCPSRRGHAGRSYLTDIAGSPRKATPTKNKDYVPQIVGLRLGSKGDEVEHLQRYLNTFGYTESPAQSVFGVATGKGAPPAPK